MNELYEFMEKVNVIVIFCIIYGFAINGIVWCVTEFIRFIVKKVKSIVAKYKKKKDTQNEDVVE